MSPIYTYNGKILTENGQIAINEACCCDGAEECGGPCGCWRVSCNTGFEALSLKRFATQAEAQAYAATLPAFPDGCCFSYPVDFLPDCPEEALVYPGLEDTPCTFESVTEPTNALTCPEGCECSEEGVCENPLP